MEQKKNKLNDPKPSYAELEERLKKLEREKAELLENSKTKSVSQQPTHKKNHSVIDTAAKLYILKFKFNVALVLVTLLLVTLLYISGGFGLK